MPPRMPKNQDVLSRKKTHPRPRPPKALKSQPKKVPKVSPKVSSEPPAVPKVENPSITPCVHFAKGTCRNGAKCRFLHAPGAGELSAPPQIQINLPSPARVANPAELPALPLPRPASPDNQPPLPDKQRETVAPAIEWPALKPEIEIEIQNPEPQPETLEPALEAPETPEPDPVAPAADPPPAAAAAPNWAQHTSSCTAPVPGKDPLLQHKWVFWEHRGLPKGGGSESAYHHAIGYVGECCTVGEFWRVLNNIPAPSQFFSLPPERTRAQVGGRLVEGWSLFRHGVHPEWEDPKNSTGAELTISSESLEQCDRWWEDALLATIGGCLPFSDQITGVRVIDKCKKGSKPVYRLEVWFTEHVDVKALKPALLEVLQNPQTSLKLKQHCTQKPLLAAKQQQATASTEDSAGRVKDVRALLAKLTPERFERLSQQLQCVLGNGSADTVAAVVQCIKQCTMQTAIFHSMYADLVVALGAVPGVCSGVIQDCLGQLSVLSEENRHNAKHAASFGAELCAREIMTEQQLTGVLSGFESDPVHIEVLCTLLTKLHPIKPLRAALQASFLWLAEVAQAGALPPRLRFMVQDVLRL